MKLLLGFACCFLLLTSLACDNEITDPSDENPPGDETIETFLANFAKEYAEMDSAGYGRYLDAGYRFYPYPEDVDPEMPEPWWDREEELLIAGRMFNGQAGDTGLRVLGIPTLQIAIKTVEEDTTHYPERPEGETWYRVTAGLDLFVQVADPEATSGDSITNFIMECDQVFIFRRDPAGSGRYVICRQLEPDAEQKSGYEGEGMAATSGCWGRLKQLFRHGGVPFGVFLTDFERAYSSMDSVAYASLLDSSYSFELRPDEVEPDMPSPWWYRADELSIAGKMFHERYGDGNVKVVSIDLDLALDSATVDVTAYPEKPFGETWYRLVTKVDLEVVIEDPSDTDEDGLTRLPVHSDQIFVIRPDPGVSGRYLAYRQTDPEPHGKLQVAAGTEAASWTGVKSLFR